jgi:hypothetical protein
VEIDEYSAVDGVGRPLVEKGLVQDWDRFAALVRRGYHGFQASYLPEGAPPRRRWPPLIDPLAHLLCVVSCVCACRVSYVVCRVSCRVSCQRFSAAGDGETQRAARRSGEDVRDRIREVRAEPLPPLCVTHQAAPATVWVWRN